MNESAWCRGFYSGVCFFKSDAKVQIFFEIRKFFFVESQKKKAKILHMSKKSTTFVPFLTATMHEQ